MIKKNLLIKNIILFLWFSFNLASAIELEDLFKVNLLVEKNQTDKLHAAFKEGLLKVLTRVSAKEEIIRDEVIAKAVEDDFLSYIESYHFGAEHTIYPDKYYLKINYSSFLISKLLLENHYRVWLENRPVTLIWLITGTDDEKTLINEESSAELVSLIEQHAEDKGVPIIFPLLDLEDNQLINKQKLWEQVPSHLKKISKRYASDAVLAIKLHKTFFGDWYSFWTLQVANKSYIWKINGAEKEELLAKGFAQMTQDLISAYGIESSVGTGLKFTMDIYGIDTAEKYAKIMQYINNLAPVKSVSVEYVSLNKLSLLIEPRADKYSVKRSIALDYVLSLKNSSTSLEYNYVTH